MTVAYPATLTSGEALVGRCLVWNPGCRQMLGLKDEERQTYNASRVQYFNRNYQLLPTLYLLPARLVAYIDQSPRSLASADCETGLVYVVYL